MTTAQNRDFASISVGETAVREHTITAEMIATFANLSGDYNPLHIDSAYAATTSFGKVVAHGMLLGALVSELVGMHLPGAQCLLIKELLEFKLPVYVDDIVRIQGTVAHKSEATNLLEISILITRGADTVAVGSVHTKILTPDAN